MTAFTEAQVADNEDDEFLALMEELGISDDLGSPADLGVTAEFFHGSPNWIGESFNNDFIGKTLGERVHKAGHRLTSDLSASRSCAGKQGTIIVAELNFKVEEVESYLTPQDKPDLIREAIMRSPLAYEYFSKNYSKSSNVPKYDLEKESYTDQQTGVENNCDLDTFLSAFGGLDKIFTNEDNFDEDSKTESAVIAHTRRLMGSETLSDAMTSIERDFYSKPRLKDVSAIARLAKDFIALKVSHGIKLSLDVESDELFTATVFDDRIISIKEIMKA